VAPGDRLDTANPPAPAPAPAAVSGALARSGAAVHAASVGALVLLATGILAVVARRRVRA
jgi:hypothetical protein